MIPEKTIALCTEWCKEIIEQQNRIQALEFIMRDYIKHYPYLYKDKVDWAKDFEKVLDEK